MPAATSPGVSHRDLLGPGPTEAVFASREEALTSVNIPVLLYWGGEYAHCLSLGLDETEASLSRGQLARAARGWSAIASCQIALGRLDDARESLAQVQALVARVGQPSFLALLAQEQRSTRDWRSWPALSFLSPPR